MGDRLLGFTPSRHATHLKVPKNGNWFVRPMGPFKEKDWRALSQDAVKSPITGLDLSERWDVTDQTLEWLGTKIPLRYLRLDKTRVTDQGLVAVGSLKTLQSLTVSPKTTDVGLQSLLGLSQLRELDIQNSKITEDALPDLRSFRKLESLRLSSVVTDRGAESLAALRSLRELDASATQMGDDATPILARLEKLEALYLSARITNASVPALNTLKSLKRLDLSRSRITDAGLRELTDLHKLEQLALTDTAVTDASMPALSRLKNLKTLELSGTQITTAGLQFLSSLMHLETLSLSWSELTSADLAALAKCPAMKNVVLDGTPVPETLMAQLIEMRRQTSDTKIVITPPALASPTRPVSPRPRVPAQAEPPSNTLVSKKPAIAFSGFTGLRKLRDIQTRQSELADVFVPAVADPSKNTTQAPDHYIGDIDVNVSPKHP